MKAQVAVWGFLAGVALYVAVGAVREAVADWWWLRGHRRAMEAHRRRMESLGRQQAE